MSFLQNDEISCCFETRVTDPDPHGSKSFGSWIPIRIHIEVKIQELSRLKLVPFRAVNALYGA
jgi:hypothetical protein